MNKVIYLEKVTLLLEILIQSNGLRKIGSSYIELREGTGSYTVLFRKVIIFIFFLKAQSSFGTTLNSWKIFYGEDQYAKKEVAVQEHSRVKIGQWTCYPGPITKPNPQKNPEWEERFLHCANKETKIRGLVLCNYRRKHGSFFVQLQRNNGKYSNVGLVCNWESRF